MQATVLSSAAMWAGIVGFFSPVIIQSVTRLSTNSQVQAVLAFVFCLAASAGTAYFAPHSSLNVHDWAKSFLLVFTLAMSSYEHFWKPVGVTPSSTSTAAPKQLQ